jgi:hypothetical protein
MGIVMDATATFDGGEWDFRLERLRYDAAQPGGAP